MLNIANHKQYIGPTLASKVLSAVKLIPASRDDIVLNIIQRRLTNAVSDNTRHCRVTK